MKVFLRSKTSRLFCAASDAWAVGEGQALEFCDVPHAAQFARDKCLLETEIILRCETLAVEVALPLVQGVYEVLTRPLPH